MQKEEGIVLCARQSPHKRYTVLTRSRGKLDVTFHYGKRFSVSPGTLLLFIVDEHRHQLVNDVEVLFVPTAHSKEAIAWLHHLVELAYYFAQPELFDEVLFMNLKSYLSLLSLPAFSHSSHKLGMFSTLHLLYQTGFYKGNLFDRYNDMLQAMSSLFLSGDSVEIMNALQALLTGLTIGEIKKIECFIIQCLKEHPFYRSFKTIFFVYPAMELKNDYANQKN